MGFYSIKFGLESSVPQTEAIDLLKTNGADVIQTSSGLCVKSEHSLDEIKNILGSNQIVIENVNRDSAAADESLSVDVKRFMGLT